MTGDEIIWIVVAVLIAFFIHLAIWERRRTRQMELAAARVGLVFQKEDPGLPFWEFSLLSTGWHRRIRNVARGEIGGCEVIVLEYRYKYGWGEATNEASQTIGAVSVAALKLPAFLLSNDASNQRGIDFDSHPQFSKIHNLVGADESAIRKLFDSQVLEFFEHEPRTSVECDGEWMIIYRHGHRVRPGEFEGFVREAMKVLDVFRSSA